MSILFCPINSFAQVVIIFLGLILAIGNLPIYAYEQNHFASNDQETFLNLIANYIHFKERAKFLVEYLIDKQFLYLDQYSLNGFTAISQLYHEYLNKDNYNTNTDYFNLILYNMLHTYVAMSYATNFEEFKNDDPILLMEIKEELSKIRESLATIDSSTEDMEFSLIGFTAIMKATKGHTGPIAQHIRKLHYMRIKS